MQFKQSLFTLFPTYDCKQCYNEYLSLHLFLHTICIHACLHAKLLQSCPTLCDLMDCSPPGSSVHWYRSGLPCAPPGGLPNPRIKPASHSYCIAGRCFTGEPPWKPHLFAYTTERLNWTINIHAAAAAAAKSLQSCPTLCDPIDGSPPGSPVPGIPQARVLEWGAIAFSAHYV